MIKESIITGDSDKIELKEILETGRNKAMSLLNLNLNISYFNIDISVLRNEEKRRKKTRKQIQNNILMDQELDRRRNMEYDSMMNYTIIHR